MPRYELLLITKTLNREGLHTLLKRTCNFIFEQNGIIRKIENLGEQELPYRMKAHTEWHTHGRYFLLDMHIKTSSIQPLKKEFKFETDIVRPTFIKSFSDFDEKEKKIPKLYECNKSYEVPFWLKTN